MSVSAVCSYLHVGACCVQLSPCECLLCAAISMCPFVGRTSTLCRRCWSGCLVNIWYTWSTSATAGTRSAACSLLFVFTIVYSGLRTFICRDTIIILYRKWNHTKNVFSLPNKCTDVVIYLTMLLSYICDALSMANVCLIVIFRQQCYAQMLE